MRLLAFSLFLLSAFFGFSTAIQAQESTWDGIDKTQVRLISAVSAVENKEIMLGLQFKMQKNWKVYWRSPGDAGYPPAIDWTGSDNLQTADIAWPKPERFVVLGLETLGYKDTVVFPITLTLLDEDSPLNLVAKVRFLTCADICVPVEKTLSLTLPAGPARASEHSQLISKFISQVPQKGEQLGVEITRAELYEDPSKPKEQATLHLTLNSLYPLSKPDAFTEGPLELAYLKPKIQLSEDNTKADIYVPLHGLDFLEKSADLYDYTLTFVSGAQSFELPFNLNLARGPLPLPQGDSDAAILLMVGFALIGGLILNLMPCVLPVLSLKLLGLIKHGGGDQGPVRRSFLATSAGILTCFLILASLLVALKLSGQSIGWGIQFQYPIFLILLSLIITLFAANMWGWFDIPLPNWVGDKIGSSSHKGFWGDFMTGGFATLLATPCSAPFLGTAIGFALARNATEIYIIFTALGLGLALPYLLVAALPKLATKLPKPGPWMVTLRKLLGLALLATVVWLASVLALQIGTIATGIFVGALGLLLAVFALKDRIRSARVRGGFILLLTAFSLLLPQLPFAQTMADSNSQAAEKIWKPFARQEIDKLVQDGKTVFVDVTAQWCITCQVNKKIVLYKEEVLPVLQEDDIVALKADWTNPDDEIAAYLAENNRFAIPFNAVYGPNAPDGILLPEILTPDVVLSAIRDARG